MEEDKTSTRTASLELDFEAARRRERPVEWYSTDHHNGLFVGGWGYYADKGPGPGNIEHFSTDLADAWLLLADVHKAGFSARRRFLQVLSSLISVPVSYPDGDREERIAWPDALLYLTPRHIARAFIQWVDEGEP